MRPPLERPNGKNRPPEKRWDPFDDSPDEEPGDHPAMTYRRPAGLRAVHGGVLTAVLGFGALGLYAAFWFVVAFWFRGTALDWMEAEQAQGRGAEASSIVVGGFPFDLRLTVAAPAYGWQAADGTAWAWQGETLVLTAAPWRPTRVTATFKGPHVVEQTGPAGTARWRGTADGLTVSFPAQAGLVGEMDIQARGLRLVDGAGMDVLALQAGRAQFIGRDAPPKVKGGHAPMMELSLRLDGVRLPPDWSLPLGRDIVGVEAGLGLTGTLDAASRDVAAALAAWRDGGGTLEVADLGIRYGALRLSTDGTMALDAAMQPIGAFTVRAEGFFELVDALWRMGLVNGRDAVTAKVVLGAFAKQRAGEARPSISLPITVQGRKVYVGPVPLMEVPLVTWPTVAAPEPALEQAPVEPAPGPENSTQQ